MNSRFYLLYLALLVVGSAAAQKNKQFHISSPDGSIQVSIEAGSTLTWSVKSGNDVVIAPSAISLTLDNGEVLGRNMKLANTKTITVNNSFATPFYKKNKVEDHYNQLTINCRNGYGLIWRVYNDGAAYRFFTNRKGDLTIASEEAAFNFENDDVAYTPYIRDPHLHDKFQTSFESLYDVHNISGFAKDTLAFLPILIDLGNGKKAAILEADMQNYPGMYVTLNPEAKYGFKGVFAPYPAEEKLGGINYLVTKRENYIAKVNGNTHFPWRVVVVSNNDGELVNSDMIQKLAAPSVLTDISWIKPGKVAWDWWNDWNISHVDFRAGINTETYKYYIDFAAANHLEYIVMDEGWSDDHDLMKIVPAINLQEIIDYGKQKGVGVVLWATWYAVLQNTDAVFAKYSSMGIKGFKIDFFDRDDQKVVASTYEIAKKAAEHKLFVDYHGMFKPTGLQRTYPNVIGFEGVKGMENVKWAPNDNVPLYDVTLPFIRMIAGPMDYTPGAMRNATKSAFRPINSMPMSQGTRCHQLAMYTVFDAPLGMLSDNPTTYMREQECTDFISAIPTTFDETVVLQGKVGEYIAVARRKGDVWYVGAMTNWTPRQLTLDFSFLGDGNYEAETFQDGINADRDATDYKKEMLSLSSKDKKVITLSNGGGWAAIIRKK